MILFDETGQGGGAHQGVYVRNVDGAPAVRLGDGTAEGISPDGRWAISVSVDRSRMILLPTGAGESRTVSIGALERLHRAYWFPDGQRLLMVANERGRAARLWVLEMAGGTPRAISPEGTSVDAAISPDGRWVAARLGSVLTLFPVAGGATRPVTGVNPNELIARWTPDGAGLYVYDPTRMPVPLMRADIATGQREQVRETAASNASSVFGIQYLFLTPDLKEYAYASLHQDSELYLVDGLNDQK